MIAIIKHPGEAPYVTDVNNTLHALQEEVGGYIETVTISSDSCIICNEEGRLMRLPFNCGVAGVAFVGTILVVGVKRDDFCSLHQDQIDFYMERVFGVKKAAPSIATTQDGGISGNH